LAGGDGSGQMDMWLQGGVPSGGLRERLGLDDMISVLRQSRWWLDGCVCGVWGAGRGVDWGGLEERLRRRTVRHAD